MLWTFDSGEVTFDSAEYTMDGGRLEPAPPPPLVGIILDGAIHITTTLEGQIKC
jgi:hypothetical protein